MVSVPSTCTFTSPTLRLRGGQKYSLLLSCDIPNGGVAHIVKYYDSSISISFNLKSLAGRLKLINDK